MKILIVGIYILSHQQSMQHFADMLTEGLLAKGHDVQVIRPEAILCKGEQAEQGLNKWLGYIDRFVLFRWQLKQAAKWADVMHICDHSNVMYAKWINTPSLVTCHDPMAIQSSLELIETNKTGFTGRWLQKSIAAGLQAITHVTYVSRNTQDEAWKLLQKRLPNLKASYFFHLGRNQWYKNRKCVAEIYSQLIQYPQYKVHKLVLAGKPWPDYLKEFR
jgi:hypothetical protein